MTLSTRPRPAPPPPDGPEAPILFGRGTSSEEVVVGYRRSPVDLLRIVLLTMVVLAALALMIGIESSILPLERDARHLLDRLPLTVDRIVHGVLELLGYLVLGCLLLTPLLTRRLRLFGCVLLADVVAIGMAALVLWPLDRRASREIVTELSAPHDLTAAVTTGEVGIAVWAASFTVLAPFVPRRLRRIGSIGLAVLVVARVVASADLPGSLLIGVPVGALAGSCVLLALGRPDRRPSLAAIQRSLRADGLDAGAVTFLADDRAGRTFFTAPVDGGGEVLVTVSGDARRADDLLDRFYRSARFRHAGEDRPFSSLQRAVEHEALMSFVARDAGVATPGVRAVAPVGLDSVLIAHDRLDSTPLADVADGAADDGALRQLFEQVAAMRRRRLAHRRLNGATVVIADDGAVHVVDLEAAALAADDTLLDIDLAQALATAAPGGGAHRTVRTAIDVLGTAAVARSLPTLQPAALSSPTRAAMHRHRGRLAELQQEVQRQAGVDELRLEQLDRVDSKRLLLLVVLAAATYFLAPQFADLPAMVERIGDANWWWAPAIVAATIATYVGAAMSLAGSVPAPIDARTVTVSQVATSFTGTLAPAGVGGMALSVRYLQKQGVERGVAVSGVGLNTVAGVLVHVSLLAVFLVWAGRRAFGGYRLPNPEWLLLGIAVVAVLAALMAAIPATRHTITTRVRPVVLRSLHAVRAVLRRPGKLALLLGGSLLVTVGNLLALYFSVVAFGRDLPLVSVGAVYLVGATIASAAPTPGGIGAIEAALISGLRAAGVPSTAAVPAVFLFRLVTFWLPTLPGWFAFRWLQRHDDI